MEYSSRRQGLIAEAQGYDDLPMYIYYYRTSGNGREIIYTNEKGPHYYPWSQRIVMDEKKAKIFEYFLASEDEGKKEALSDFLESLYKPLRNPKGKFLERAILALEDIYYSESKLAKLRHKVAKKVDKVLGTNLEETKLSPRLKKIEKAISDKFFKER